MTTIIPPSADAKSKQWADLAERAVWTLLQGGTAIGIVELLNIPEAYAIPIMGALAAIKSKLTQKFSTTGTAATLPERLDPATPPGQINPDPA